MIRFFFVMMLFCNISYAGCNEYYNVDDDYSFYIMELDIVNDVKHFSLNGIYDNSTCYKISQVIKVYSNYDIVIHADSRGGRADELLQIMDIIHTHGRVTWIVDDGAECMSSCAITGIAANKIDGTLQFHGITIKNTNIPVKHLSNKINKKIKEYGFEGPKIEKLLDTIYILTPLTFKNGIIQ